MSFSCISLRALRTESPGATLITPATSELLVSRSCLAVLVGLSIPFHLRRRSATWQSALFRPASQIGYLAVCLVSSRKAELSAQELRGNVRALVINVRLCSEFSSPDARIDRKRTPASP